jgi:hypothetical protein
MVIRVGGQAGFDAEPAGVPAGPVPFKGQGVGAVRGNVTRIESSSVVVVRGVNKVLPALLVGGEKRREAGFGECRSREHGYEQNRERKGKNNFFHDNPPENMNSL